MDQEMPNNFSPIGEIPDGIVNEGVKFFSALGKDSKSHTIPPANRDKKNVNSDTLSPDSEKFEITTSSVLFDPPPIKDLAKERPSENSKKHPLSRAPKPHAIPMPNRGNLILENINGNLLFNKNSIKPVFYTVNILNRFKNRVSNNFSSVSNKFSEFFFGKENKNPTYSGVRDEKKSEALVKEFNYIAMGKNEDRDIVKSFLSEINKGNPDYNNWEKGNDKKINFLAKIKKIEPNFENNGRFKSAVIDALQMGLYIREMKSSNKSSTSSDPDFNNNLNTLIDALDQDVINKEKNQDKKYKSKIGQIAKLASIFINSEFNGNDSSNQLVPTKFKVILKPEFEVILKHAYNLKASFFYDDEEKLLPENPLPINPLPINPLPINPSSITSTIEEKLLSEENSKTGSHSRIAATIEVKSLSGENPKMESPSTTAATIDSTRLSSQSREQVG